MEIEVKLFATLRDYLPKGSSRFSCKMEVDGHTQVLDILSKLKIPEEISKIFEQFYRVKHPKTRHVVGTGLGLPIVKGIVEAHRGSVTVESTPGKGSTFKVVLPTLADIPDDYPFLP